jgi:hypothetical protein
MPPPTPRPLASIRTGDVVVLLGSSEVTEGEVIVTMSDGRYRVTWAAGSRLSRSDHDGHGRGDSEEDLVYGWTRYRLTASGSTVAPKPG